MVNPTASESIHHNAVDVTKSSSNTTNSLQLNDDSTTSRMTQLDIEQNDPNGTTTTRNHNINHDNDPYDVGMEEEDDNDVPPLSTYLAGWKFWLQFAIWPFVFLMLNGVIVSTLVTFDEYEFQHGKRRYSHYSGYYDIDSISSERRRDSSIAYEMLKYNRMIIAVLLLIDALIIYRAILFLDRKVRELDMIGDVNHDDENTNPFATPVSAPSHHGLTPNVHAQVSRKLDTILGRHPQSRVSILVSLLWLLFVGCGTVGLVAVADLLFAISPKGKQVCKGSQQQQRPESSHTSSYNNNQGTDDAFNPFPSDFDYNNTAVKKRIDGIPEELQEWAQSRNDMYSQLSTLIHLTNGMTYFTATDPTDNRTNDEMSMDYMYGISRTQLVSIGTDGKLSIYKNALNPISFTSFSEGNYINATGFCCLYRPVGERSKSNPFDEMGIYHEPDVALLCTQSSDTIVNDIFPNVTVYDQPHTRGTGMQTNFEFASIKLYKGVIWVKVSVYTWDDRNGDTRSSVSYYNVTYGQNKMEKNPVATIYRSPFGYDEFDNGPFLIGPGSPCYKWTRNIDVFVFLLVLGLACAWLINVKNLSVGIVPGVVAVSMLLTRINHDLGLAMSSLATIAMFLGLLGCVRIPWNRERMIWALYTLLFCVGGLIFTGRFFYYYDSIYNFARALVTITIASLIGFILNHPVLYLFGWVGGIWAIFCGIFLLFTPPYGGSNYHAGIFALGLGIIMGSGCATIGFNLTKYRAHIVFYSKRAWFAMNAAMHSNNNNHRVGRNNPSSTSTTTRYAPVMHIPPTPPTVNANNREYGDNDITAGLLNQNVEGRTRSN